ncbi:MAG: DNA (cytosine-5-)-methyltransferase [Sphingomonadales bacterium 28-64-96]|nr:MAG: DNA (cytosine-5-)-methyltransferase [Sphingomonadales bacterium 28-64-96]
MRPIGIDLFSGAGGMSLGFEQAGFDVVAAVEIDPIHAAIHSWNFPACKTVCKSVAQVTGGELRLLAGIGDKPVDVVFGGAPCQGFSMMGQRALDDPRNMLVKEFVRLVTELKARYFVFENVKGITVGAHKQFLKELIEELIGAGYDVQTSWKVLNAANYAVPQDRHRLFLMGCRKGETLPTYPLPITQIAGGKKVSPTDLPDGPTCSDALSDVPDAELYDSLIENDAVKVEFGEPSAYASSLRGLSNDADKFGYKRLTDPSLLTSSLRTNHTELSRQRFAATPQGSVEPVSRFFKLPPDGVSNTLRAGTDSQRGAFTSPRPIHYKYARCITVREMARLHGFPDWFRFHVTKWHGARQIGNAVPPPLARAVASRIIAALGITPTIPTGALKPGSDALLSYDMQSAAKYFRVHRGVIPQRNR